MLILPVSSASYASKSDLVHQVLGAFSIRTYEGPPTPVCLVARGLGLGLLRVDARCIELLNIQPNFL